MYILIIIFCSENFATAVSARFLWGFLNGNVGVVKTYLSEVRYTLSVYCIQCLSVCQLEYSPCLCIVHTVYVEIFRKFLFSRVSKIAKFKTLVILSILKIYTVVTFAHAYIKTRVKMSLHSKIFHQPLESRYPYRYGILEHKGKKKAPRCLPCTYTCAHSIVFNF